MRLGLGVLFATVLLYLLDRAVSIYERDIALKTHSVKTVDKALEDIAHMMVPFTDDESSSLN